MGLRNCKNAGQTLKAQNLLLFSMKQTPLLSGKDCEACDHIECCDWICAFSSGSKTFSELLFAAFVKCSLMIFSFSRLQFLIKCEKCKNRQKRNRLLDKLTESLSYSYKEHKSEKKRYLTFQNCLNDVLSKCTGWQKTATSAKMRKVGSESVRQSVWLQVDKIGEGSWILDTGSFLDTFSQWSRSVWLLAGWPDPPCGRIINPRATTISGSRQHNSSIEPQRRRLPCFDMRSHWGKFWSEKQPNTSTEQWWWPWPWWWGPEIYKSLIDESKEE